VVIAISVCITVIVTVCLTFAAGYLINKLNQ